MDAWDGCSKTATQHYAYEQRWEAVCAAYMARFPRHPRLPVLVDSAVLDDRSDRAIRTVRRRCTIDIDAPSWMKRALGFSHVVFIQTTTIDPARRSMRIRNINETFSGKAVLGDECEYRASETNPEQTLFEQVAYFQLPRFPLARQVEKFMCRQYEKHTGDGRHIDEEFIQLALKPNALWDTLVAQFNNDMAALVLNMPVQIIKEPSDAKLPNAIEITPAATERKASFGQSIATIIRQVTTSILAKILIFKASVKSIHSLSRNANANVNTTVLHDSHDVKVAVEHAPIPVREAALVLLAAVISIPILTSAVITSTAHVAMVSGWSCLWTLVIVYIHITVYPESWMTVAKRFILPNTTNNLTSMSNSTSFKGSNHDLARSASHHDDSLPRHRPSTVDSTISTTDSIYSPNLLSVPTKLSKTSSTEETSDDDEDDAMVAPTALTIHDDDSDSEVSSEEDDDDGLEVDESMFLGPDSNSSDDTELGDLSNIRLTDLSISVPLYIDKSVSSPGLFHYVVEVKYPNGHVRAVQRLYTDFVQLRKFFAKKIPQCKVQLLPSFIPKKKSDTLALSLALDHRRTVLESYLKGLLMDEAVAKFAQRALLGFLKRRGMLFVRPGTGTKRRFFSSSSFSGVPMFDPVSDTSRAAILLKAQWKTCLRETRVVLDKAASTVSLYCRTPPSKSPHCVFSTDSLTNVTYMNQQPSCALPVRSDQMHFIQIETSHFDTFVLGGEPSIIQTWYNDLIAMKPAHRLPSLSTSSTTYRSMVRRNDLAATDGRIILNRRRIMFGRSPSADHPCAVVESILSTLLALFQEYTVQKCTFTPDIVKKLGEFAEISCSIQQIDLERLVTHSERLSFWLNLYHTMIIHAHLELGVGPVPSVSSSSKRVNLTFRTACYDVGGQLFSIQDVEQSILRAKMSRPIILKNSFFAQLWQPRFKKRDMRNKWCLTKPDLRINFVLNSGVKSSIYNVWVFSSDPNVLNSQLDHASTHFLNEQVSVDMHRNIIYVPRICQYYANDLGGTKSRILKTIIMYMSTQMEREVKNLLKQERMGTGKVKIRFTEFDWAVRGVFFRGHHVATTDLDGCQLKQLDKEKVMGTGSVQASPTRPSGVTSG